MCQRILAGIILTLTAATSFAASISGQGTWETTLEGRAPLTPGRWDYQAYYDTALDLTWSANTAFAWPVLDGDPFAPVPIPAALWLLGSALGVLGCMKRRATKA